MKSPRSSRDAHGPGCFRRTAINCLVPHRRDRECCPTTRPLAQVAALCPRKMQWRGLKGGLCSVLLTTLCNSRSIRVLSVTLHEPPANTSPRSGSGNVD